MKQTEIGLIPDDWEVKEIKDFADVTTGDKNTQDAEENGKYPFYVRSPIVERINKFSYDTEGVLTAGDGVGTGKVFHYAKGKFGLHQRAYLIYNFKNTDPKYFYYNFSKNFYERVHSMTAKSSVDSVRREMITKMQIPIPPTLAEQQRIAKALSDVDALISTTEKLIQKKKNIKQGTMQNLLTGKKRLPGFGDKQTDLFVPNGTHTKEVKDVSPEQIRLSAKMKQTELGEIPEDWEVKSLGEIFEFRPNNTFTRDCLNDSKGEYQNVHYGDVLIKYPSILDCSKESIPFINEGINVKFSKYGIVEGDIIIADTAEDETVGKVVEVFNLGEKKIVSGLHTFLCRKITDDFAPKWLGYFMNQAIFHNQLLPFITGTKVSAISRTAIQNVKVLIPSKEEQTAIANVLSSMDKEIETLNTKLEKYINLKTAMMQQLLTGKIRLR